MQLYQIKNDINQIKYCKKRKKRKIKINEIKKNLLRIRDKINSIIWYISVKSIGFLVNKRLWKKDVAITLWKITFFISRFK